MYFCHSAVLGRMCTEFHCKVSQSRRMCFELHSRHFLFQIPVLVLIQYYCYYYCFCCYYHSRSRVLRTQKLRSPSVENQEPTNVLTLKIESEYSHACFPSCQEFLPRPNLDSSGLFIFIVPRFSPCLLTVLQLTQFPVRDTE